MAKARMKCMRCGHEYELTPDVAERVERSCPRCRSNSVRMVRKE